MGTTAGAGGAGRAAACVIGTALVATLVTDVVVLLHRPGHADRREHAGRYVAATRASAPPVSVASLPRRALEPHLLIAASSSLPPGVVDRVRAAKGTVGVEVVDAASTSVGSRRVGLLGVEPGTFRAFTPKPSAESDALWRNIGAGDMAVSFAMGQDGGLPLGGMVTAGSRYRPGQVRVGAYATMGIGEADAVVSHLRAHELGLPHGNALVVSASPRARATLGKRLKKLLPPGVNVVTVNTGTPAAGMGGGTGDGPPAGHGETMTARQIETAIRAGYTKLGMPYVWGGESDAEGGYDCSGIIQWSYARAGVRMPRVAADQARTGPRIPYSQARAGDLLTWALDPTAPGYISHIAIYIGGGNMLVARRRGTVLSVQPVFLRGFQGAIRVNPKIAARLAIRLG